MNRFTTITVGAAAAGETLVNALSGIGEKKRKIVSLRYAHAATDALSGAPANSLYTRIRAYRDQDQFIDVSIGSFQWAMVSNLPYLERGDVVLTDTILEKGEGLKIGFFNASVVPYGNLVMEYQDLE